MKHRHRLLLLLFTIIILIAGFGWQQQGNILAAQPLSPAEAVAQAWQQAQESGRYHYRSLVEQTIYPAPAVANAGRPPRQDRLALEGTVDVAAETLNLTLWQDGSFDPQSGVEVKVEEGQAYGRLGQGEWQAMDNVADAFAPGEDPLGFLAGATNIQAAGTESRDFNGLTLTYTRYTFDMNGPAFAAYMLEQMEAHQQKYGPLPAGVKLSPPEAYQRMIGAGELWINEQGLPARLEIRVEMPDQPKAGERVSAVIQNDYFDYDLAHLEQASRPFTADPSGWLAYRLPQVGTAVQNALPHVPLFLVFLIALVLCWRYRRTHQFQVALALFLVASLLFTPLLQGEQAHAYFSRVAADQEAQETRQEEAEARQELETAVSEHHTWDAHKDPLATKNDEWTPDRKDGAASPKLSRPVAFRPAALPALQVDNTDSDNDGLNDDDENYWGTCAYTVGSASYNASADCANVTNPADSDGDGLSDFVEVNDLNTYPTSADTDGDTITDTLEIQGFSYNGQMWYLDPVHEDTNDDGLVDSGECDLFSGSGPVNLATACGDTDGDGQPDFNDDDNDGDGVPDANDGSPGSVSSQSYDNDNPLQLSINNLTVGEPVLVDIELRPTIAEHLEYNYHVLDWPYDDKGQIQRHLDTTWADTADTTYQSAAANAANGDIRLLPMLEIIMPYSDGHYANLPVNSTYYGINRTLGITVGQWLDEEVTAPYSMSIDDLDTTTGDLVAYVPLSPVTDDNDTPVAFATRLIYQPSQASWGQAHQMRVVWLVQMLTDECIDASEDEDTCARQDTVTVIHSYDEAWQLTGLNVSEERGLDVALLYEDPMADENLDYDDQLWAASWNLGNSFLRGRDCDSMANGNCNRNGQRDVTVANLATNVPAWNLDYTDVSTFSYEHQGFAAHVMMTETVSILDTVFTPYANSTVPTILVAQEHSSRALNLDAHPGEIGSTLAIDMDEDAVPEQLQASLSWASYTYEDGSWQNYEAEEYLEYLEQTLATEDYFQPADSSQESADEADGKLLWAQMYYASLYAGAQAIVEADGEVVWEPSVALPETDFAPVIPVNTGHGAGTIASEFAIVYASKKISVEASETGIWAYFKRNIQATADDGYQFTRFNKGGLGSNTAALMVMAIAAVGIAILAVGLITGDDGLIQAGVTILAIITIIVTVFYIAAAIQKIVTAVSITTGFVATLSAGLAAGRWFQGVGVIGFILGVLITWGVVGVMILTKGLSGVSLGMALSLAIASTIVLLIYFILDLIGLGVIVLIIVLFDALFALLGSKGPTQLLTEAIADTLYGVYYMLKNLDDSTRLDLDLDGMGFLDDDLGFTIQNSFIFTVAVTNTLRYNTEFSFSELENRTVFRYHLQDDETDQHEALTQGEMVGEWVEVDGDEVRTSNLLSITIPLSRIGTGIDQSLDGEMYVTEAYIAPYQGCWKFAGIDTDCSWYKLSGSSHINLGQELIYDVLPGTLRDFVNMDWDSQLPEQVDGDNDGLTETAAADPSGEFDGDGDGLSDYYEIIYGLNATDDDPDGDGLNDAQELLYATNPFAADSDSDGLNDTIETRTGWLVVYENNGQSSLTRVWSDPNAADADGDTMDDLEEFIFGFHPQVSSDPSSISNLVQFNNLEVAEDNGMNLLTQFEETAGSTVLVDSSGSGHDATCEGAACPTLAQNGRYAYAASFNGSNYVDTGESVATLARADFSIGAWVKTSSTNVGILTKNDGDSIWETGEKSFYLNASGQPTFVGFGNNYIRSNMAVNDNQWHHLMVVWDYSGSGSSGTGTMYVDGRGVTGSVNYAANNNDVSSHTVKIGRANNGGEAPNHFNGYLDEVVVFERVLSAAEVAQVRDGRYNANDLIVLPDADLTYRATVTNTSSTTANGFLTAETAVIEPEMGTPGVALSFEPDEQIAYFTNELGEENTVNCYGDGTCPTAGIDAFVGAGIDFDGINDYAVLPTIVNLTSGGYAFAFWIYVESLPATGQTAMILDTDSTATGAMDIYLNSSGNLVFNVAGYGTYTSNYSFSGNLNQWRHVTWNENNTYINGLLNTSNNTSLNARIGNGRLGNNMSGTQPFNGRLDEIVYYDENLDDGSNGGTSFNAIADVMNGAYYTDWPPHLLFTFEELTSYDGTIFYDSQTNTDNATCTQPACPILTGSSGGYSGRAITFDGTNDYLTAPGSYTTGSDGEVSVSFYVKLSAYPATNAYIFDTTSGTDVLDMYINSSGQIVATRQEGTHTSIGTIPLNQWVPIVLTYDRSYSSGNWRYDSHLYINGAFDSTRNYRIGSSTSSWDIVLTIGSGRIGSSVSGSNFFSGSMDEMNLAFAVYDFDPPTTNLGYENLANNYRAAACSDVFLCPTLTAGHFGYAATFDGNDDYLTVNQGVNFFGGGNFTQAAWIYPTMSDTGFHGIMGYQNGNPIYRAPSLWVTQQTRLHGGFGDGTNWNSFTTDSVLTLNAWNHVAATFDGTTYRIYVNGAEVYSTTTLAGKTPYAATVFEIGRVDSYFQGKIDEVVVLPTAVSANAIPLLMNSTYPFIDIPTLYESFSAAALSSLEVSGTAEVSPNIVTSKHQFDQEVEAALQFQAQIDYPVVDDQSASLGYYLPFEEAPGSTNFDNLISYYNGTINVEGTCSGSGCPVAGVRGQIDRALFFDGLDDSLTLNMTDVSGSWRPDIRTISVWINGKQGTIMDSSSADIQLDMNQLTTEFNDVTTTTDLTLPRDEWIHLVVTIDSNDVATVYVNGTAVTTSSHNDGYLNPTTYRLYLGVNQYGQDFFQGYMDDFRSYETALSAAQVQTLYQNSAPVLRFEFDEDDTAASFLDNSVNTYVGQPTTQTCADFSLEAASNNAPTADAASYYITLGGEMLFSTAVAANETHEPQITTSFCEDSNLSVTLVYSNGTTAVLNSPVIIDVADTGQHTVSFAGSGGSNPTSLTYSVGESFYVPNPLPGTNGRIANGALFDGNGYVTITDATVPLNLITDFTIAAWVKTTETSAGLLVKTDSDTSWERYEKAFYLNNVGQPTFVGFGNNYIRSNTAVNDGQWHYVAVVWDRNSSGTGGTGKIYVDGTDVTGSVNYSANNADRSTDTLKIGAPNYNAGEAPNNFVGNLDELTAYRRALSAAELYSLYLREVRWYRDRASSTITVDTDAPTVELLSDAIYWANGYLQLAVATTDPTSGIALLDFGLKAPGDPDFTWSGAPPCQDNGVDGAAWCPAFDTSALGGEGAYEVQFRAVDVVGNQTSSQIYTLYVDDSVPTASSNYSGQWATMAAQDDERLNWTVSLTGSLSDPALNTSPAVAGSGVVTQTVRVELVDAGGKVTHTESQQAAVNGNSWSLDYVLSGARPAGTYTIYVTLEDNVGNSATVPVGTLRFDERSPKATFNNWLVADTVISNTTTLRGNVSDQADWAGEMAAYAFEESVGATVFYDSSENGVHLNCTNCPAVVTNGRFGQALDFDGVNDSLSTYTGTNTPFDNELTLAAWIKPDVITTGIDRFISLGDETAVLRIDNQRLHFYMRIDGTLQQVVASNVLTAGQWQHVAGSYDGQTMRLYHNGIEVGTREIAGEIIHTAVPLQHMDLSSGLETFDGQMDEVLVYNRALAAYELYALAQSDVMGLQSMQVALEPFDFSGTNPPVANWQAATISNGTWSYPIPANTAGLYNIYLRAADNNGNITNEGPVWSGIIDNAPPIITATGQRLGGGSAAQTQYTFSFSDFVLDDSSYVQPCGTAELVSLTYNDATLPQDGMPYQATATCRLPGTEAGRTFTACDGVGLCTSQIVTVPPSAPTNSVVILEPTDGDVISGEGVVNISGGAYASNGIESVTVSVDGVLIATRSGSGQTDLPWNSNWTPIATGEHTITAVLTSQSGTTYTDSIVVTVESLGQVSLDVNRNGNGSGMVSSLPAGISCGADCTEEFAAGSVVSLAAAAATDSTFTGWSGACSGTGVCLVTMDGMKEVTATFTLQTFTLSVSKNGNGSGSVNSSPGGISCGADCTEVYNYGASVTLTAVPATGSNFTGWSGGCTGMGACTVSMTAARNVAATFTLQTYALAAAVNGTGSGSVSSSPAGINCPADCTQNYNYGTMVTLTAVPATGSTFTGWTGGICTGTSNCVLTMDAAKIVAATFTLNQYDLTVNRDGAGNGLVTSSPAGIECGDDCSQTYDYGTVIMLTAVSDTGSDFTGWSGACTGAGDCVVSIEAAREVTATFDLQTYELSVALEGTGSGSVSSLPAGISCQPDCVETYEYGTVITLTAAAATGSSFTGWGGVCEGSGELCTVLVDEASAVTATFTLQSYRLAVDGIDNGSGLISSSPGGINCGEDCEEVYEYGTVVTLTAVANTGSTFIGWSGACHGLGVCVLTMDTAHEVVASFILQTYELSAALDGTGSGSISSVPAGISCQPDCAETYNYGTVVTLTATAATGSIFNGWNGICEGSDPVCTVLMDEAKAVTATFTLQTYQLAVAKSDNGSGLVSSSPVGINCGEDCVEVYDYGTVVTLTAVPDIGSDFIGWSGACTGTGDCVLTMDALREVVAIFALQTYGLSVAFDGTGSGTVSSVPAGINCHPDCVGTFEYGTIVTLTATADTSSTFAGWSGACTGSSNCVVTIEAVQQVTATFTLNQYNVSVSQIGTGGGFISSSPDGITCGDSCVAPFDYGTVVTLTALAATGSTFMGWSGVCSGATDCVLTVEAASHVTATFTLGTNALTVLPDGNGSGSITSDLAGIECGVDCVEIYDYGTVVTLTAVPDADSHFTGWGGACTGMGVCVVTMDAAREVTATFTLVELPIHQIFLPVVIRP